MVNFILRGIAYEGKKIGVFEKDFIRALEINPDQPQILNYMGYSLREKRKAGSGYENDLKANEKAPDSYHIIDPWDGLFIEVEITKALFI